MDHIEDQRIQLNNDEHVQHIKISSIKVNPYQPRKHLMRRNFKI